MGRFSSPFFRVDLVEWVVEIGMPRVEVWGAIRGLATGARGTIVATGATEGVGISGASFFATFGDLGPTRTVEWAARTQVPGGTCFAVLDFGGTSGGERVVGVVVGSNERAPDITGTLPVAPTILWPV